MCAGSARGGPGTPGEMHKKAHMQSLVWNQLASERLSTLGHEPVVGDLVLVDAAHSDDGMHVRHWCSADVTNVPWALAFS